MRKAEQPELDADSDVLVFRGVTGAPVAVPADVVYEMERCYRVHLAYIDGTPWKEIAEIEGYPDARTCYADYKRYMDEARSLVIEASMRDSVLIEVARLDALQHAVWPAAMAGFIPAVNQARQIIMDRLKVKGWNPDKSDEHADSIKTVVITGELADRYVDELRAISGPDTPPAGLVGGRPVFGQATVVSEP